MLEDDVIDCIIDLPGQLFFNVQIPASIWFFNKDKASWKNNRSGQVLFIDARKMGSPVSRTQIEFSDDEIAKIAETFYSWANGDYQDVDWYCRSVSLEEIARKNYVLSPGRFISTGDVSDDLRLNSEVIGELTATLAEQMALANELNVRISKSVKALGYEV
jgi:type I restriction enzyme M protein